MGQLIRQIGPNTTRYYWYPGDKKEWLRALLAVGAGGAVLGLTYFLTRSWLAATTLGITVASGVAGFNFGRRDLAAAEALNARTPRRDAASAVGRASWRGFAQGAVVGFGTLIVVHLPATGFVADWLLPLAPGVVFGLAWQASLVAGRLSHESTKATEFVGPEATRRLDPDAVRSADPDAVGGADPDETRGVDADRTRRVGADRTRRVDPDETLSHAGPLAEAAEDVRRS
ncbi:hypothetical protein ACQP00_07715 [Dactylosporangium sp. CS-047395]|uniref:hypothetical protein n=1 Tax=Dactylosporangium sp. CS-047395 TaxID=3239936 RepID=UPI003D8D5941